MKSVHRGIQLNPLITVPLFKLVQFLMRTRPAVHDSRSLGNYSGQGNHCANIKRSPRWKHMQKFDLIGTRTGYICEQWLRLHQELIHWIDFSISCSWCSWPLMLYVRCSWTCCIQGNSFYYGQQILAKETKRDFFYLTFHSLKPLGMLISFSLLTISVFSLACRILHWSHSYKDVQCYFPW